jgi:hypothetical protein
MTKLRKKYDTAAIFKTDGISLCVYFKKQKASKKSKKKAIDISDENFVIGIDPGRHNIAFAYGTDGVSEVRKKLTRKDYYNQGHLTAYKEKCIRWAKKHKIFFKGSMKSAVTDEMIEYIDYNFDNWDVIWKEYGHLKYAKSKMVVYMKKKSVLDRFLNSLKHPIKRTVIAFGGAKIAPNGRGELSVPTTSVYKHCRRVFETVLIDEFHTSQYCPHCDNKMTKVKIDDVKCRGLLRCKTNECRSAFLHGHISDRFARIDFEGVLFSRDYVGAKNIHRCYFGRPECLRRPGNHNYGP